MFDAFDMLSRLARHMTPLHRVNKYHLAPVDVSVLSLPAGAEPLTVAFQGKDLCLWALVPVGDGKETERYFRVAGTGHDIPERIQRYIGTAHQNDWQLGFHVFELPPPIAETPPSPEPERR